MKVNSKLLLKVIRDFSYIVDKSITGDWVHYLIVEKKYVGDGWRLVSRQPAGHGEIQTNWYISDQDLFITDDNRYILHDTQGHMVYLALYNDSRRRAGDEVSEAAVDEDLRVETHKVFITEDYIDTSTLTQSQFLFLMDVRLRGACPGLDGTNTGALRCYELMGLLTSKSDYIGGGDNLDSWTMKPIYQGHFDKPPRTFRPSLVEFNTRMLIEVANIRNLGTQQQYHEIFLVHNDDKGEPDWAHRVSVTQVRRMTGSWQLTGSYMGFLLNWTIPDQEITLSETGVCQVSSVDGSSYHLMFRYNAPASPHVMQQVISGGKSWNEIEFPEAQ